jgi:DtxR family Mn-dependent transcriptional regulator
MRLLPPATIGPPAAPRPAGAPAGTITPVPEGFHPPVEEYLEAILSLEEEGAAVIQARLVERLGRSAQSVSETVHRLVEEGYLLRTGRAIELTTEGRRRAESVVRRHRLAERLLVDVLGLPWHQAHLEAGRWEHVISDDVEARLVAVLGNPRTCPHGNPIPGTGADLSAQRLIAEALPGEAVRLERITEKVETDHAALTWLDELGLVPGREATVRSRDADGGVTVELGGEPNAGELVSLGAAMCRQLYVVGVLPASPALPSQGHGATEPAHADRRRRIPAV